MTRKCQFSYDGEIAEYRMQLVDQIAEIERILNFYRFSLYKGEKAVDELIILGDSPEIDHIVSEIRSNYETPINSYRRSRSSITTSSVEI